MTAPMVPDGRVSAWAQAWGLLKAAKEFRSNGEFYKHPENRELYDQLLREAQLFAVLTNQPVDVGLATGRWLTDVTEKQSEANALRRDREERLLEKMGVEFKDGTDE